MPRALWTGTIGFGRIDIPVKLYGMVKEQRPRFRLLHKEDGSPIRMEYVCQKDGLVVDKEDLTNGFEDQPGHFVVVDPDEKKAAAVGPSESFALRDFVKQGDIEPRYYDTPYYLLPADGGARAYAFLREALRDSGTVGLTRFVMRKLQHGAVLHVSGNVLVLSTLRFGADLFDLSRLDVPAVDPVPRQERTMARDLLTSLARPFDPKKVPDENTDNLVRAIYASRDRDKGAPPTPSPGRETQDLLELLQKGLIKSEAVHESAPDSRAAGRT